MVSYGLCEEIMNDYVLRTRCVCSNTDALGGNKVKYKQTFLKSCILTQPYSQGHVMSLRCKQLIDEVV